jgi:hypothetical protein
MNRMLLSSRLWWSEPDLPAISHPRRSACSSDCFCLPNPSQSSRIPEYVSPSPFASDLFGTATLHGRLLCTSSALPGAYRIPSGAGLLIPSRTLPRTSVRWIGLSEGVPLPRPRLQVVAGTVPPKCARSTLPARSGILCRAARGELRDRPLPTSSTRAPEATPN